MMSRLLALIAALGLLVAACASSVDTLESAAPGNEVVDASSTSVATAAPVVYETGRDALEASQGKPHVLWFWAPN